MDFLDLYCQPLLGYTIDSYLGVEDESRFDATSKEVRAFKREWVYQMYRVMDIDTLVENCENIEWAKLYLRKMNPYLTRVECRCNFHEFQVPTIRNLSNLRELTFAVPLVLDVSIGSIHPNTYQIWGSVDRFLQSLATRPNKLEHVSIVPGILKLVRTDPTTQHYLDEKIVYDTTEGTHLRYYRRFGLPVMLMFAIPKQNHFRLKSFKCPSWVLPLSTREKTKNIDWGTQEEGVGSMFLDLFS
jgi:hypothetical protein